MKIVELGISDFKSFDSDGILLKNLGKINIFIGKNNSGKSNILKFFRLFSNYPGSFKFPYEIIENQYKRNGKTPKLTISIKGKDYPKAGILKEDDVVTIKFDLKSKAILDSSFKVMDERQLLKLQDRYTSANKSHLVEAVEHLFFDYLIHGELVRFNNLIYIPDFREIKKQSNQGDSKIIDGSNIISEMFKLKNPKIGEEKETLKKIQTFVKDLLGVESLEIEIPHTQEEIILNINDTRLPLNSFGTGVHELVILCSALAIYNDRIVCIEEPELHLHPQLQRKFLDFLDKTNNTYFITTHSNVFLDTKNNVSIYHVTYDGDKTTICHSNTDSKSYEILNDLGFKASDMLQSNGIIWVEGPSDWIYLKKWLSLICSDFIEGIHYSIMFYGGKLVSHLSTKPDFLSDEFISLLKINRNAIIIIDRDGFSSAVKLSDTKERINKETKEGNCWITKGREIENYLSATTMTQWLKSQYNDDAVNFKYSENTKIQESIRKASKKIKIDYDSRKTFYAKEIVSFINTTDLEVSDLKKRVNSIIARIKEWNHEGNK